MRKVLFSRESECIQPLRRLIERQQHKTLCVWALDCAQRYLSLFEARVPDDPRPREALQAGDAWMRGQIKMPMARQLILAAHRAATEAEARGDRVACAAARALGHAAATVHTETHALGLPFYGLTALCHQDPEHRDEAVAKELQRLCERLEYWAAHIGELQTAWAPFLEKNAPNKEALRREKEALRNAALAPR